MLYSRHFLYVKKAACRQGHREFPFGNSREFGIAKFPAGIPGNFAKIAIGYFFPVISSLFVQFHYHLQQTLSVNYNVLSINHWSIISIGTKLQFRNPQGPFSGFGPIDPVRIECMQTAERKLRHFVYESHG